MAMYVILLVIIQFVLQEVNGIVWQSGCDQYESTANKTVAVGHFEFQEVGLTVCQSMCADRPECGGFNYGSPSGGIGCYMVNINNKIIAQHLNDNWWLTTWPGRTWYSNTCDYSTESSDLSCNTYDERVHVNKSIIDTSKQITFAESSQTNPPLSRGDCHRWCTLHTDCRSAHYDGSRRCVLYSTTVQDLLDAGLGHMVYNESFEGSSDRYCSNGNPYIPSGSDNAAGSDGKSSCLYGEGEVVTEDGEIKMIKDLAAGDKVMSMSDSGQVMYDEVYIITHISPRQTTKFTYIIVAGKERPLYLTDKHMIIVDGVEKRAEQVAPGDKVHVHDNKTGRIMIGTVTSVGYEYKRGFSNPVTLGGRMVVNGVLASAYPHVYEPLTAAIMHSVLWGVRMAYHGLPNAINTMDENYGMPTIVKYSVIFMDFFEKLTP